VDLCTLVKKNYSQVEKEGNVRYMKCSQEPCDGSAKLQNGEFRVKFYTEVFYR